MGQFLKDFKQLRREWRKIRRRASEDDLKAEFDQFNRMVKPGGKRLDNSWDDKLLCPDEKTPTTKFDRHYVYHIAWAARILANTRPAYHVDIGSSLYFPATVSAFIPVRFYDLRPPEIELSDLAVGSADLVNLPFDDGSVPSLSCMHTVEHVGLGRYGDALNPDGDLRAAGELQRVTAPGGSLLFVVPVGKPRIQFNAHRIYSTRHVRDMFAGMELVEFALIADGKDSIGMLTNPDDSVVQGQEFGCGCFWFRKPPAQPPLNR